MDHFKPSKGDKNQLVRSLRRMAADANEDGHSSSLANDLLTLSEYLQQQTQPGVPALDSALKALGDELHDARAVHHAVHAEWLSMQNKRVPRIIMRPDNDHYAFCNEGERAMMKKVWLDLIGKYAENEDTYMLFAEMFNRITQEAIYTPENTAHAIHGMVTERRIPPDAAAGFIAIFDESARNLRAQMQSQAFQLN